MKAMTEDWKKILGMVLRLRSTISFNGLVFKLKSIPLIGKLFPDSLYKSVTLKALFWVIQIIKKILVLFLGGFLALSVIYLISWGLASSYAEDLGISVKCAYGIFAYMLFLDYGVLDMNFGVNFFKCTTEKEYMVFMLRMNAAKLNTTIFGYNLIRMFIGYMLAGVIAIITGAPVIVWLLIPFLGVFMRLAEAGTLTFRYQRRFRNNRPMHEGTGSLVFRLLFVSTVCPLLVFYVLSGNIMPVWVIAPAVIIFFVLGAFGIISLKKTDSTIHRKALAEEKQSRVARNEAYKHPDKTKKYKRVDLKAKVKDDKKGFEFLSALFFKRHRGAIITEAVFITLSVFLIVVISVSVFLNNYSKDFGSDAMKDMLLRNSINFLTLKGFEDPNITEDSLILPFFIRWFLGRHLAAMAVPMFISDATRRICQVMFIGCDKSLMTYNFFKQPEPITKLYKIRLKQVITINMIPAAAIGFWFNSFLFLTGGQEYQFQYLFTFAVPVLMSMINSVYFMLIYYLFQPYTATVEVKSGSYMAAYFGALLPLFIFSALPVNALVLSLIIGVILAILLFISPKLVYRYAHKTWRVKA